MKTPVYFISDIHLKLNTSIEEEKRCSHLYKLLDKIIDSGGTCFFVGDLFDFYFEYPDLIPKAYTDFYIKASEMKNNNVDLHFLLGNHDYWIQDFMQKKLMNKIYYKETFININNKKFLITHGDGLLSWDHGYRILKFIIRSKFFIWLLRWIHPTITYNIAKFISRSGYHDSSSMKNNQKVKDELISIAKTHFDNNLDYMICGHYHLGEMFKVNKGKLAVLGDWFHKPSYAIFDGKELKLINYTTDAET